MPPNTRGIQPLPSHPLQGRRKRKGKNLGRRNRDSTTNGHYYYDWPGLNDKEKAELIPTLSTTDNWILLTHPQRASNKSQPPFGKSQRIARANGKCSRHTGWWRKEKTIGLATHSMTTEVWISTREQISEATRMTIQEPLEE